MVTVREAFEVQLQNFKPNDFLFYSVVLGDGELNQDTIKLRGCNSITDLEAAYTVRDALTNAPYPILTPKEFPNVYPHIDSERTDYALGSTMDIIRSYAKADLEAFLEHVFWESSTDYIVANGLPTKEDVKCWQRTINRREDLSVDARTSLVSTCELYITGG
jgi:hypothetical protein